MSTKDTAVDLTESTEPHCENLSPYHGEIRISPVGEIEVFYEGSWVTNCCSVTGK